MSKWMTYSIVRIPLGKETRQVRKTKKHGPQMRIVQVQGRQRVIRGPCPITHIEFYQLDGGY